MMYTLNFDSSTIHRVDYDRSTARMVLYFTTTTTGYEFDNVPESIITGLKDAESVGKYYNSNIRGKFPKVEAA